MSEASTQGISRRNLIAGAAATGALSAFGMGLAGCASDDGASSEGAPATATPAAVTPERLRAYARLVVEAGCALRSGQELFVRADINAADFVRLIVAEAYDLGARHVTVRFNDEVIDRMHYDNCALDVFEEFPAWAAELNNSMAKGGAAMLSILSDDPEGMSGVDPRKLAASAQASHAACKEYYDALDFGRCVWCIVGAASPTWAAKVFPELGEQEAVDALWNAILAAARVEGEDAAASVAAWEAHGASFEERCAWLNDQRFDALRYTNAHGTNLTVGLPAKHIWNGGGDTTVEGVQFFPNMPTEEVFTAPDRLRVEGTVVSALPLSHNGSLVENFSVTFEGGRAVRVQAERGQDVLQSVVDADENSCRLGEVALVPFDSPIRESGVLFYNTLYDENASCHLALGMGYLDCYEGGFDMTSEELLAAGVNQSATHVDFMVGTEDLNITGIKANGEEVPVFINGTWAF